MIKKLKDNYVRILKLFILALILIIFFFFPNLVQSEHQTIPMSFVGLFLLLPFSYFSFELYKILKK